MVLSLAKSGLVWRAVTQLLSCICANVIVDIIGMILIKSVQLKLWFPAEAVLEIQLVLVLQILLLFVQVELANVEFILV